MATRRKRNGKPEPEKVDEVDKDVDASDDVEGEAVAMAPPNQSSGLRVMDDKAVNDYMEQLMQSKTPPPDMVELEIGALSQFRGISMRQGDVERTLTRRKAEVEQLKADLSRLQGQSEAYVNLLVLAEDSRRANPPTKSAED